MLAGRIYGLHDYRLGEAEMPKIEEPTDVLLKVTVTAICTSEVHYVAPVITHVFPLPEFDKALDIFAHKKDGTIKVVLKP